jgi:hypothetical protein
MEFGRGMKKVGIILSVPISILLVTNARPARDNLINTVNIN